MRHLNHLSLVLALILMLGGTHHLHAALVLDQKKIHTSYEDGDFETVTRTLEAFMASNKTYARADSIFIAKHLAVVYSANPKTREKGKYYMYRLLEMLPSAKLVDMYVSDEIDRIFEKVREEFAYRQKGFGVDSSQMQLPERAPATVANTSPPEKKTPGNSKSSGSVTSTSESNSHKKTNWKPYWIAAGAASAVAVGVTAYLMTSSTKSSSEQVLVVPAQ